VSCSGGTFDYEVKAERLEEVLRQMEDPSIWENPEQAQKLGQEKVKLEEIVQTLDAVASGAKDSFEMLMLAQEEGDQDLADEVAADLQEIEEQLGKLEFQRMFSGPMDANNSFIDIQSGSGSTEAQGWANMLLRMYWL